MSALEDNRWNGAARDEAPASLAATLALQISAAKAKLQQSQQMGKCSRTFSGCREAFFRVKSQQHPTGPPRQGDPGPEPVVNQVKEVSWPEVTDQVRAGLSGHWPLAVFLAVGHVAAHLTGPSVLVSVAVSGLASFVTGLCICEFLTRPQVRPQGQPRPQPCNAQDPDTMDSNQSLGSGGRHLLTFFYLTFGELPAFFIGWLDILVNLSAVGFCSRAITATVDRTTNSTLHTMVLDKFGTTPFLDTYPDFLAGALVMSFSLLVGAGLERSKALQRWVNCLTCTALFMITLVGACDAQWSNFQGQDFMFDGYRGVSLAASVLSLAFGGCYELGRGSQASGNPHRLLPPSMGLFQLIVTLSMLMVALVMPFVTNLGVAGSVPEMPLFQVFQGDLEARPWLKMLMALLAILCLCSALLEFTVPLHKAVLTMANDGLLPRSLGSLYWRTGTPFFGGAFIGSCGAVVATLGDVTRLLVISATAKVALDLAISFAAMTTRYGACSLSKGSASLSEAGSARGHSNSTGLPSSGSYLSDSGMAPATVTRWRRPRRRRRQGSLRKVNKIYSKLMKKQQERMLKATQQPNIAPSVGGGQAKVKANAQGSARPPAGLSRLKKLFDLSSTPSALSLRSWGRKYRGLNRRSTAKGPKDTAALGSDGTGHEVIDIEEFSTFLGPGMAPLDLAGPPGPRLFQVADPPATILSEASPSCYGTDPEASPGPDSSSSSSQSSPDTDSDTVSSDDDDDGAFSEDPEDRDVAARTSGEDTDDVDSVVAEYYRKVQPGSSISIISSNVVDGADVDRIPRSSSYLLDNSLTLMPAAGGRQGRHRPQTWAKVRTKGAREPTEKSAGLVFSLAVLLVMALTFQSFVVSSGDRMMRPKALPAMVTFNLALLVLVLVMLVNIAKQPQLLQDGAGGRDRRRPRRSRRPGSSGCGALLSWCRARNTRMFRLREEDRDGGVPAEGPEGPDPPALEGRSINSYRVPWAPWVHALALFFNVHLLTRALSVTWTETILWLAAGFLVYVFYGVANSGENIRRRKPEQQQRRPSQGPERTGAASGGTC